MAITLLIVLVVPGLRPAKAKLPDSAPLEFVHSWDQHFTRLQIAPKRCPPSFTSSAGTSHRILLAGIDHAAIQVASARKPALWVSSCKSPCFKFGALLTPCRAQFCKCIAVPVKVQIVQTRLYSCPQPASLTPFTNFRPTLAHKSLQPCCPHACQAHMHAPSLEARRGCSPHST